MRTRLRWLGEQVGWFLGILGCMLLLIVLLPLVSLFETYDDIRRATRTGKAEGRLSTR